MNFLLKITTEAVPVDAVRCRWRGESVAEVSDKGMLSLKGGAFAGEASKELCSLR